MIKKMFIFIVMITPVFSGCTSGKDVLARINDQPLERNELREWAEARKISPDLLRTDPEARKNMLKQLALEKIISEKASAEGFDRNADYIRVKDTVYRNFLTTYYNSRHFRKLKFKEKCADISIIRIFFKGSAGGVDYKDKAVIINTSILPALSRGEDFSALAMKYSMDSAKSRGGSLGFVPVKMLEDELQSAVLLLKDGTYTEKPVVAGNSLCLIRLNRMVNLTEANIEQYITDKVTRGRIHAYVKRQASEISENTLKNNPAIVSRLSTARFNSDSEFLFSAGSVTCTAGDVKKILNIFYMLRNNETRNSFPAEELKLTAERMLHETVISSEAVRLGYDNDPEFKKNWKYLERATLTGMYKSSYIFKNVTVSREDVEAGYKSAIMKNKNSKSVSNNPVTVKAGIYSQIYRSKFRKIKDSWEKSLLTENRYTVTGTD
ncbi:MAG TPA: peptidylprolyl isomerase [Spirochaetota bacterium]|nr:peptidylprolyl isomerase [Spirochaetota bacterium]